jgi:hypothetical protein
MLALKTVDVRFQKQTQFAAVLSSFFSETMQAEILTEKFRYAATHGHCRRTACPPGLS